MQTQELKDLWERLESLRAQVLELVARATDEDLAWVPAGILNPPAVILRHLAGAESFWITQVAGGHDVGRDRAQEFARPLWSRAQLLEALSRSRDRSERTFRELADRDLDEPVGRALEHRPPFAPPELTRRWAILHAMEHESYHLGQLMLLMRIRNESEAHT